MKKRQLTITEKDFMLANRKASREEEIAAHGRQVSMRSMLHKSKRSYSRSRLGKHSVPEQEI